MMTGGFWKNTTSFVLVKGYRGSGSHLDQLGGRGVVGSRPARYLTYPII